MHFIDTNHDAWQAPASDVGAAFKPAPHLLLDLAQWRAVRTDWPAGMAVGLALANDADVEDITTDLPRFSLIALHFPKWVDGRAYSQARLLRARYRFSGQIRVTGDVLADMLPLLQRTGFDAVLLRGDQSVEVARRALGFVPRHYQGDVLHTLPHFSEVDA